MQATIQGCDIVWPSPIATAASRYARGRSDWGRNTSRGTFDIAWSTRSSEMPRRRSWRSTMRSRASVDVVSEGVRVMHQHLAAPGGDQAGPLELRQEARRALARGAGELGDLR